MLKVTFSMVILFGIWSRIADGISLYSRSLSILQSSLLAVIFIRESTGGSEQVSASFDGYQTIKTGGHFLLWK